MATKYIEYPPRVLQGQSALKFNRTRKMLIYKGDNDVASHISRGLPLYETKLQEKRGENENGNLIMRGECISACAYLLENNIQVDLVYIDPPFASGADYAKKVYLRRNPKIAEELAKAETELDNEDMRTFEAKMYGDIWEKEKYLNWMYENLMAIKSVMSPTASIYVHLDYHIGHYVKILLDEVFGESNFRNEIIWFYNNKMSGNTTSHAFVCEHDSIFLYSNSDENIYNTLYEKREESIKQSKRVKVDGKNMRARDENGNIIYEVSEEKKIKDVWQIPYIASTDSQRTGYATQKPEALLERIIKASSDEGMVVADFFGGSGVAAAVAHKTGRRFIHVDINDNSISTARDRLVKEGAFTRRSRAVEIL
ncbi:MAG: site-specific DNA-methyltransferase, partial [Muribaculaceae bacterium]|nr:site-specific DNA-methyltransferase [Muribaculaceae bacterium]